MADISSFTHKWRANLAGSHQTEAGHRVIKRNRQPVSCAPCRSRKLKCDRGHPCDACLKRNDEDACVYGRSNPTVQTRREEPKANIKAQERLRHLEELVKQMIGPEKNVLTPQTPPTDDQPHPEGSLSRDMNGTSYTGSTHWATVLDQIQELRNVLSPNSNTEDDNSFQTSGGMIDSLFAAPEPPPLHILLERYLPPREECNRYLSTYFNAKYLIIPFIHTYEFKRQYERFWDNQLGTSPIWISLLFSIMCVADNIRHMPLSMHKSDSITPRQRPPFLAASAQCLVLGNYVKPQPFIVEALAMHGQCKYAVTLDPSHELGMIFSILVRQAYTMGYHREPDMFEGQFTVFESEIRRRTWSLLRQFDVMVSFQFGLPVVMQPESSDTRCPSHLLDEDFDEDTQVLPPPRPDTEATQMLYLITKARLMETYGRVCNHTLAFPKQPFTAADIMALDTAITQCIELVPAVLRAKPMSSTYADPTSLTMNRSNLMFLGEKARCTLHRKYMVSGPTQQVSRRTCVDSSTRTISHFLDLHAELQPGGQLFNDRWMMSSFTINDFLLALMVACLAFSLSRKDYITSGGDSEKWLDNNDEAAKIYQLLERAQPVCAHYGSKAREARHVAEAIRLMLTKLRPKNIKNVRTIGNGQGGSQLDDINTNLPIGNPSTEIDGDKMPVNIVPLSIHGGDTNATNMDTTMNNLNLQSDFTPSSSLDFSTSASGPLTYSNPTEPSPTSSWEMTDNPLPNILEGPEQIDWVQFDQFLWTYGMQSGMDDEIL